MWKQKGPQLGKTKRRMRTLRRFGIELEVCRCPDYELIKPHTPFGAKYDGSVRGQSMEFVSPILSGDSGLRTVENFCNYTQAHKWGVDRSCGYHLHIDASDLEGWQRRKVAYAYALTEKFWRRCVPSWRRNGRWCEKLKADPALLKDKTKWNSVAGTNGRYSWCNICAYDQHGTIEIRLHHGTLRRKEVTNWIRLHLWFFDKVLKMKWETLEKIFAGKSANAIYNLLRRANGESSLMNFYEHRGHFVRCKVKK